MTGRPAKQCGPQGHLLCDGYEPGTDGAAGYGFHHQSDDGKYLIMGNGSRAFAIRNEEAQEHAAPEKMTVLVVEPRKEPYLKEIDPGLHSLQAEVGGDIAASYPFSDPVGLVCNE